MGLFERRCTGDGDWLLFGALLKLDVEEALGPGGVTGAAGSVGTGSIVHGGLVALAAGFGAMAGEAGPLSVITSRLEGVVSRPPSSPERTTAATPESVMYSAR